MVSRRHLRDGTGHGTAFSLLSSEVVNRVRVSERGSAMAILNSIFDLALLFGAPMIGFLIESFGLIVGILVYRVWDRHLMATSAPFVAKEESVEQS